MSTIKKRKHPIIDDSDDENFIAPVVKKGPKESKHPKTLPDITKDNGKKKMKRIVLLDSDDEENSNEVVSDSINDIKKNAKARAKKLAAGSENLDSFAKPPKSPKTTPPVCKQKNNILNYFKPMNSPGIGNDKNENTAKIKKEPKQKNKTNLFIDQSNKPKLELKDDDGYTYTNVIKKSSLSPTRDKFDQKESDRKKSSIIVTIYNKNDEEPEFPRKKLDSLVVGTSNYAKESPCKLVNQLNEIENDKNKESSGKEIDLIIKKEKKPKSPKKLSSFMVSAEPSLPRIIESPKVSDLWVDKYKPTSTKQIIGQQGDRSAVNKLIKWLRSWHQNLDKKLGYGKWRSDDGLGLRAALLSGPPGIGKTTTAQLVCQELGYDYLELNASDTRNKKSLHENVRDLLKNTKLTDFFKSSSEQRDDKKLTARHCLIMDEVDGVSGNEDRGGVAELIQLIKSTMIPIICICNERGDQKIRSLVNYCFDLRFTKPKLEQIKAFLMSIAYKENVQVAPDVLNDLVVSSNYDIRQCIHNFYLLITSSIYRQKKIDKMINPNEKPIKDVRLTPFDAIRKVFSTGQEYGLMSFNDKSDLFFCDYSIMPLFVYENYITINLASKEPSVGKQLKRLYKSIDAISYGELIEKEIRTNQAWSLLPVQAAFSTVMPGSYMRSQNGLAFPQFPQFMGKLSTTNKNIRIIEELISHMKLSINESKSSMVLDYIEPFRNIIINSLFNFGKDAAISMVIDLLEQYSLSKEDMDSILEFCLWAGDEDPMKGIDFKMKSALTRAYNKKDFTLPYVRDGDFRAISSSKSKKAKSKKSGMSSQDSEQSDEDAVPENMDFY